MPADLGHNIGTEVETFTEVLARFKVAADAFGDVTDENAQKIRDHIGYGGSISKDIDQQREREKKPHLDAGRKIDGAYKPLVTECDEIVKALKRKLGAWMDAREREARRVADEKAKALRDAEEAARKAQEEPEEDPFLAATAPAIVPDLKVAHAEAKTAESAALAAGRVSSAAGGFNAAGLRTVRKAKVNDWGALAQHYIANGELRACLQKLADADIRHAKGADISIPGVEIITERVL